MQPMDKIPFYSLKAGTESGKPVVRDRRQAGFLEDNSEKRSGTGKVKISRTDGQMIPRLRSLYFESLLKRSDSKYYIRACIKTTSGM